MNRAKPRRGGDRARAWRFAIALASILVLVPFAVQPLMGTANAQTDSTGSENDDNAAAAPAVGSAGADVNERSEFWRAVRQGVSGYSAVQGQETNVLIQNSGQNWRAVRSGVLSTYGAWLLAATIGVLLLVYILKGSVRISAGRSDYTIERWTMIDRVLHWFTALSFLILAVTGLSLLYGRDVLIPFLGKDGFASVAAICKVIHNYLGPFFAVSLIIELLKWLRHNFPTMTDLVWLLKGGGVLIKSIHPSAGRMNGGEKIWYWFLFWLGGFALVGSGLILDFPSFGQPRDVMQMANIIHIAAGMILLALALGHIYIGTIGTEGALEGMVTGRVDVNWAKQHHDLWYEEIRREGVEPVKTPADIDSDAVRSR